MKIKTSELIGSALDWAVAKAEGRTDLYVDFDGELVGADDFEYSSDWSQGGPIIERERIAVRPNGCFDEWHANTQKYHDQWQYGDTPLVAAMRCYVASKLGDTVDIPDGLM